MPVIDVRNNPFNSHGQMLLADCIRRTTIELGIAGLSHPSSVTVSVVSNRLGLDDNTTLVVRVWGLYARSDRTDEDRFRLSGQLSHALMQHMMNARCYGWSVEVFVDPFWNPQVDPCAVITEGDLEMDETAAD